VTDSAQPYLHALAAFRGGWGALRPHQKHKPCIWGNA